MVAYRFPQGSAEDRQFGPLGGACARQGSAATAIAG
jgi:hypothetical protein